MLPFEGEFNETWSDFAAPCGGARAGRYGRLRKESAVSTESVERGYGRERDKPDSAALELPCLTLTRQSLGFSHLGGSHKILDVLELG